MKNIYLSLVVLASSFFSFSQNVRVDYDNSSKWFLGLNGGGTWHSTDVKYRLAGGWGLTLGKTYNYNYGRFLSFDIRGRYLNGNWYGQDKDSTALSGLTTENPLYQYQTTPGYTYHNFKSNVHRLAIELAIHLNAITQRTGWDPYIFGGVGLTWNQTSGNLTDSSEIMVGANPYAYGPNGTEGINFDDSYETYLDGYSPDKYNVTFMPSLGFGLGYHIGKRTTFGIEHKTTFTQKDVFDAVQSEIVRPKMDLYHYTSLYLQFRFWGRNSSENNTTPSNVNNDFNSNCPEPEIISAYQNTMTVTNPSFNLDFMVQGVNSYNAIEILNGNNTPILFNYNASTSRVTAQTTLNSGLNQFRITVKNRCGSASKLISVIYKPCNMPSGSFISPSSGNTKVTNPAYLFSAIVYSVNNKSSVKLFANGILIPNFSFNSASGLIQANYNLQPGLNTFRMDLSNECGTESFETSIYYDNCVPPTLSFLNPTNTGISVNNASFEFLANVTGINNKQQLTLELNGIRIREFSLLNGKLRAEFNLFQGINTIVLTAKNDCGEITQQTSVNYQSCNAPLIQLINPLQNSTVTSPMVNIKTKLTNVPSKQNIGFELNGAPVNNFNYSTTTQLAELSLNLQPGMNTIQVRAFNTCGMDVETIYIEYNNCKAPTITITSSPNEVVNSSYTLTALITEMPNSDGITLTRNGQAISFSYANGQLISAVTLLPGTNTFVVKSIKSCGSDSKTIVVNYNDCLPPTLSIVSPNSGVTVNTAQMNVQLIAANISNVNQVLFTVNNQPIVPSLTNGVIAANVNLVEGSNSVVVKVTNNCGTVSKSIQINRKSCVPPTVSIQTPVQNTTVNSAALTLTASLTNTDSYSLQLNGVEINATREGNSVFANLNLIEGNNVLTLIGNNSCGTDIESVNIVYNNCQAPAINVTSGNSISSNSIYILAANITNSNAASIVLTCNGIQSPFTFSGNQLSANLNLNQGNNTISLSSANACGNDLETFSVSYNPCIAPHINVQNPGANSLTVNIGTYTYEATISGSVNFNQITLIHNQTPVTNFSLNNGLLVAQINLITGPNIINLSVQNACGNDSKEVNVIGRLCLTPQIALNPLLSSSSSTQNFVFGATVQNITSVADVTLLLNGVGITNFNLSNQILQANLNLSPGQNTIVVVAENECGNTSKTHNVSFNEPCNPPSISFINLPPSGSSINANSIQLNAQIENYTANTVVVVTVNGNVTQNYQNVNGALSGNINLPSVPLVIQISASNQCGNASESYTISKCKAATLTLIAPGSNNFTTSNASENLIFNVSNVSNINQVQITNNGQVLPNVSFNGSQVQALTQLAPGQNVINITINNNCNLINESITIIYNQVNTDGENNLVPNNSSLLNNGSSTGNENNNGAGTNNSSKGNAGSTIKPEPQGNVNKTPQQTPTNTSKPKPQGNVNKTPQQTPTNTSKPKPKGNVNKTPQQPPTNTKSTENGNNPPKESDPEKKTGSKTINPKPGIDKTKTPNTGNEKQKEQQNNSPQKEKSEPKSNTNGKGGGN